MASTGALPVLVRVLANRDLRRVLFSYLAFHIAEFATWVAILLYAYEATGAASVGVVAVVQLVPAAIVAAPAAALGDRYPRHRVLTAGYLAQALAMLVTAVAMLAGGSPVVVYAAATVAATALVITRPTQSALLPSLSSTPDELTAANGAAGVVEGFGVLIGPLVAAAILVGSSVGVVFLVAGGALVVAALSTIGLAPRDVRSAGASRSEPAPDHQHGHDPSHREHEHRGVEDIHDDSLWAGLRTVAGDPDARLIVGLLTAKMLVVGAADVLFVLLALDLLDIGEPGAGLLNAALGAGTILGGALAFALVGRERLALVVAAGAIVWGVALGAVGLSGIAALAPGLIVLGGAGLTILEVSGRTLLQRSIRDEVLTRVFGIQEGLGMAGLAVGSILVVILVEVLGLVGAVVAISALLPIAALATWTRLSAVDRRATPPIQALELLRRTSLFRPLPPPQLEAVARRGTWLTVAKHTELIREGETGDRYYVIAEGTVRVTHGDRLVRLMEGAGVGFGEIALLRDVPRTATVTAHTDCVLFAIDRGPFLAAVTGHPDAQHAANAEVEARPD